MTKHGMVGTRMYNSWRGMKQRCLNQNHKDYANYGGRGIKICADWMTFSGFEKWAFENGYKSDLTIDRTDPNGNYCPENCTWESNIKQMNNKRNNIKVKTADGVVTLGDFCRKSGIRYGTAQMRYYRGKTVFLTHEAAETALEAQK